MDTKQTQIETDVEWVHEIGSHIARGDTLDEALAATVSFAIALVNCDRCFIYVSGRRRTGALGLETFGSRRAEVRQAPARARATRPYWRNIGFHWPFRATARSTPKRGFLINGQPILARRLYQYRC